MSLALKIQMNDTMSLFVRQVAGADLFWEKSTDGWLLVADKPNEQGVYMMVSLDFIMRAVAYQWNTSTTWKNSFGNGRRPPLVTGNAPVTDQVLQISQER
jgi:hypothetical protein